jgi:hypothetical protein
MTRAVKKKNLKRVDNNLKGNCLIINVFRAEDIDTSPGLKGLFDGLVITVHQGTPLSIRIKSGRIF